MMMKFKFENELQFEKTIFYIPKGCMEKNETKINNFDFTKKEIGVM
jgi:hypothetical protein